MPRDIHLCRGGESRRQGDVEDVETALRSVGQPDGISGHCVKRDGNAKSAHACTATMSKFGKAMRAEAVCHLNVSQISRLIFLKRLCAHMSTCEGCFLAFHPVRTEVTLKGKMDG